MIRSQNVKNWSRKTTDRTKCARKLTSVRLGEIKFNYPNSAAAALVKRVKKPYLCVPLDGLIRKYGSYKNNNLCWSPTRWPYINQEHKMADEKSRLSTPRSSGHHARGITRPSFTYDIYKHTYISMCMCFLWVCEYCVVQQRLVF